MLIDNSKELIDELSQNFLDFSFEANSQRAFADARDGLKPGQRACLWEMYDKGYTSNKPHVKSAKIDGGVAANWWPEMPSFLKRPLQADRPTRLWPIRFRDLFKLILLRFT